MTITRRRNRLAAGHIVAAAGIGAALALAGGTPALADAAHHPLPALDLVIPTTSPEPPDLPEAVPTDEPTGPAGLPEGPGDLTSCEDHLGEDVCDHPDPTDEPTEPTEPVDPCEPTDPTEGIDDLTAVIPMPDGGELHLTAEVADCTPTTGGGGGAPFTG
jgi:hypothetical protein